MGTGWPVRISTPGLSPAGPWNDRVGTDSVGVDTYEGGWAADGFGAPGDFDGPRVPACALGDVVDDDRGFSAGCEVTEFLCGLHLAAAPPAGAAWCVTTCAIAASQQRESRMRPPTRCVTSQLTRPPLHTRSAAVAAILRGSASAGLWPRWPRSTIRNVLGAHPGWHPGGRARPAR